MYERYITYKPIYSILTNYTILYFIILYYITNLYKSTLQKGEKK